MSQNDDFLRGHVVPRSDSQLARRALHAVRAGNVEAQNAMDMICDEDGVSRSFWHSHMHGL